jgi:hypothetical protein
MLGIFRQRGLRLWVIALYALSMAVVGFAHRGTPASPSSGVDLAAYALPDGTLPTLCQDGETGKAPSVVSAACDACLLTAAPGLLPCETLASSSPVYTDLILPAGDGVLGRDGRSGHVAHLRGPPAA